MAASFFTFVAGETWKSSNVQRKLLWIAGSGLWLALCLLAARALDLAALYLPLAIAGGLIFYLRNLSKVAQQVVAEQVYENRVLRQPPITVGEAGSLGKSCFAMGLARLEMVRA